MRKNDAFRRAAALMAALSITVSLAAPAFAGTYYIDYGDITITKNADGSQTVQHGKQDGTTTTENDSGEIIITTSNADKTTLESDLEGPAAEDSGFGPVVEDNYQPAPPAQPEDAEEPKDADQPEDAEKPEGTDQPEDAEEPKDADQPENTDRQEDADQPESTEEPKSADRQESADQQAQPQQAAPAAAPAASTPKNDKGNGFCKNIITVINKCADKVLNLTLKDVKIDVSDTGIPGTTIKGKAALSVQGKGNVEIELDGDNELKSGANRAGLEKNTSDSTGTLTLKDDNKEAGSLKATGGENGAGIGGGNRGSGKNITIKGGTVNATGGENGAGIGGGGGCWGSGEDITIKGGTVTAAGGRFGAGIGGGLLGSGKNITITDGTVNAAGGQFGAGIGGGNRGSGEDITIKGGTVTAAGGLQAAGIGGGNGGGGNGGGGREGSGKNITITGGTVNTTGGDNGGAGIGGGFLGSGEAITITGGTVNATGTDGAGIGGGYYGNGENIKITDGTVNATGGWGGAGIGGGDEGNGEDITITGGTVTAKGGSGGAGIGGGERGNGEDITITDGTVNAAGGVSGAGIGGGWKGSGSNVTVSGAAQVTAITGKPDWGGAGATIGSGGNETGGQPVDGDELQADIKGLITGWIHHIIYEQDGTTIKKEWWEPERPQPNPEDPNAPAEESNEVSLGTPGLHVETLEGDLLPFDARQQGGTLRVTTDNLAARLHGTRQALEALQEQGVEQIVFVTTLKTTTLSVAELLAEGGSWFALEHDGLGSRQLSAAQAESLKCWMH